MAIPNQYRSIGRPHVATHRYDRVTGLCALWRGNRRIYFDFIEFQTINSQSGYDPAVHWTTRTESLRLPLRASFCAAVSASSMLASRRACRTSDSSLSRSNGVIPTNLTLTETVGQGLTIDSAGRTLSGMKKPTSTGAATKPYYVSIPIAGSVTFEVKASDRETAIAAAWKA